MAYAMRKFMHNTGTGACAVMPRLFTLMVVPPMTSGETAENRSDEVSHEDMLVRVGKTRDRDAFITLFEYYAPRLKSWLLQSRTSEAQAEEIVQNTMTAVWQKAKSYDPDKAKASTWIFTIARNKRIDAFRKTGARETALEDIPGERRDEDAVLPDAQAAQAQTREILQRAVAELPEEQAELLHMAFFEDKTHQKIADETGLPLGTVKSRLRLALKKLREGLDEGRELLP